MKISAQHVFKSKAQPKQGHLLLADPHLTEAFFERAVILLVAHDQFTCIVLQASMALVRLRKIYFLGAIGKKY